MANGKQICIGKVEIERSRRGVEDKPMSCKSGVAGLIPGFF